MLVSVSPLGAIHFPDNFNVLCVFSFRCWFLSLLLFRALRYYSTQRCNWIKWAKFQITWKCWAAAARDELISQGAISGRRREQFRKQGGGREGRGERGQGIMEAFKCSRMRGVMTRPRGLMPWLRLAKGAGHEMLCGWRSRKGGYLYKWESMFYCNLSRVWQLQGLHLW